MSSMNDKRLVVAALTWSVGVLFAAYVFRVLFTDPRYDTATNILTPAATAAVTSVLSSND